MADKTRQAADRAWAGTRKNLLFNGDFRIWQRGTSHSTEGYGSDDRWATAIPGDAGTTNSRQSFTVGQTDVPGNPRYFCRNVVTAGTTTSSAAVKLQWVEDVTSTSGETLTLSFWAKASTSMNVSSEFVQDFGTGGSPSSEVNSIGVVKHALTTSWQKFTATATMPSVSGKTLGTNSDDKWNVAFWFDAGSDFNSRTDSLGHQSGTIDIARVQVELSDGASEFEHRPFSEELLLCQRYYSKSYNLGIFPGTASDLGRVQYLANDNGSHIYSVDLPVMMRGNPTVTVYSPATGTSGKLRDASSGDLNVSLFQIGQKRFVVSAGGGTANASGQMQYTADAEL